MDCKRTPFRIAEGFQLSCSHPGGYHVGRIEVYKSKAADGRLVMRVRKADVVHGQRRRGYGTEMYAAAAKIACVDFKLPLASDTTRSASADAFWRKQLRKKRATATYSGGKRPAEFVLTCPAPISLGRQR